MSIRCANNRLVAVYFTQTATATRAHWSAKNANGSFYHEGRRCYSYGSHFLLARIATTDSYPSGCVLVNNTSTTPTANKHRCVLVDVCVEKLGADAVIFVPDPDNVGEEILPIEAVKIANLANKVGRARSESSKARLMREIEDTKRNGRNICHFLGVKCWSLFEE